MIRHILFDLDCTLYPASSGLEDEVLVRMKQYLACFLGKSVEEAWDLRRDHIGRYGTTLEWLMAEKGFTDIDDYLRKLHPEDEAESLPPDPGLRRFLESLPCARSVLTNAPGFHAERIIKKLGLEGVFTAVFDIESNSFMGKPHASAFRNALNALGLRIDEALFIDDLPRYVEGFIALGGKGILLDERDAYRGYPHERIKNLREITRFLGEAPGSAET